MKRTLMLLALVACGGSTETPVEEVTYGDDTVVEGQSDLDKVRAKIAAQVAALQSADPDAFLATQALGADSFMVGPVDVAIMEGAGPLEATVRRVMGGMPSSTQVEVREHRLEVEGDSAYTAHEMVISAEGETVPYRAVQVWRKTPEGWRVAASAWTIAIPDARTEQMAEADALPQSAPITERIDAGCEGVAANLRSWRDDAQLPPAENAVGGLSFGTAPEEAGEFTQEQYDSIAAAVEAGQARPAAGPGGIRAQRVGALCFVATTIDYTFGPMTLPMRAVVVARAAGGVYPVASFSLVLPREPASMPEQGEGPETQSSP